MISFCSVCFGDPLSPLSKGLSFGILALLAVVFIVLFSFAGFFWNIRNRTRKIQI